MNADATVITLLLAIVAVAAALSPPVVFFTEMVKMLVAGAFKRKMPSEFVPAIAVGVGIAFAFLLPIQLSADWRFTALAGALAGLMASGLFKQGSVANGGNSTVLLMPIAGSDQQPRASPPAYPGRGGNSA